MCGLISPFSLETAKKSEESYDDAMKVAKELPEASPIRLGLALNFSVFFYEIRNNSTRACELAQEVNFLVLCCYLIFLQWMFGVCIVDHKIFGGGNILGLNFLI